MNLEHKMFDYMDASIDANYNVDYAEDIIISEEFKTIAVSQATL